MIDKRKHYILVLDTETANTQVDNKGRLNMNSVLVYDVGYQVVDTRGNVYKQASFVNRDIYLYEKDLMKSAYYAEKLPQYHADLMAGKRIMSNTFGIKQAVKETMNEYGIKEVAAHNARFDVNALNGTQRYVSKSKYRYFFPYGTIFWDTMKMANDIICSKPAYRKFCENNGLLTKRNQVRKTAEALYRYISGNPNFVENHTGLEDVEIESKILAYCFRQKKKMKKELYAKREPMDDIRGC